MTNLIHTPAQAIETSSGHEVDTNAPSLLPSTGPGLLLRTTRESLGISTDEIANRLKLTKTMVEDLESDTFDKEIPFTFVRGYLRSYARLLDIDPESVLKCFNNLGLLERRDQYLKIPLSSRGSSEINWQRRIIVIGTGVAFVFGLAALLWWRVAFVSKPAPLALLPVEPSTLVSSQEGVSGSDSTSNVINGTQQVHIANTVDPNAANHLAKSTTSDTEQPIGVVPAPINTNNAANNTAPTANTAAVQPATSANTQAASAAPVKPLLAGTTASLSMTFTDRCWVEVMDAHGKRLVDGLYTKGSVLDITADLPAHIVFGKPAAVKLSVNGSPHDLATFNPAKTARFTLGADHNQ